jgi:spore maturation protein CgeB
LQRDAFVSPDLSIIVAAYGGYWNRFSVPGLDNRGHAGLDTIAAATRKARLNLILARRANRDGHVMRTFEAASCGGCLLVEDTEEHRQIFGNTVTYFSNPAEMVWAAGGLLKDPDRRKASAEASRKLIVHDGKHTYLDRLDTIVTEPRQVPPR